MLNEGEVKALDAQFVETDTGNKTLATHRKGKREQPTAAEVIAKVVALVHETKSARNAAERCEFAQIIINKFSAKADNAIDGIINVINRGEEGPLPSLVESMDRYIVIQRGIVEGVKDLSDKANAEHQAEHQRVRDQLQDKFNAARGKVGPTTETKQ